MNFPAQPEKFSVVIITLNAAAQLAGCLQSVAFADEILVMDAGSCDGTPEIAARWGARVISQDWLGFGRQKQAAVAAAANDWVLCLDADERVSESLASNLRSTLAAPPLPAYRMARCNRFMGRWLRHGEGYPDWSLRLFNRRHARWSDDDVHEKVVCATPAGKLMGDLLHESAETLDDYLAKQNRYTTLQAETLFQRGRRATAAHLVLAPLFRFVKFYLWRGGFRDGVPGLVHIAIGCFNSFYKYAKLWAMTRERHL
ncbi:MAG TPA: glycosyltransferase family 2 protein [Betaproteobacteria bacterium]|nr:glycosyltransferase family 2 protein [Betaproteobacteria bacterium]